MAEAHELDQILSELDPSETETQDYATMLMEVYEATERTYRAATQAGTAMPGLASSTNY
jgi:hypothetical protein